MTNHNSLTGAVMLETIWKTRNQDLLDLISPFVFYAVAKVHSPRDIIDEKQVLEFVRSEFGYVDMPSAVVEKVFNRNSNFFQKSYGKYKLNAALDKTVSEIEKRREECEQKIIKLGEEIASYLETHVKRHKAYSIDQAIAALQEFFTRHGLFLGTNQLEEHSDEVMTIENDYYIAQYLYEKRDASEIEYYYALDLVKGYFLQSAIYLQASNGDIVTSTFKNVSFYYDTPFILRLLGFKTTEEENSAIELHKALEKQKGHFYYFPQTQHEIENILYAYQKSIGHSGHWTLEGLDEKKYSSSDVERLKATWETKLNSLFNTHLAPQPAYPMNSDGTVKLHYVIDEDAFESYLKEKIKWSSVDSMEADMESILGIHKLRQSIQSEAIEHCQAIFVTTNKTLAREANNYYKRNVCENTFPLLITDTDLAALTWVKCGSVVDLPERQLLRNAYMATQPMPEIIEKFTQVLDQMQTEGKVTESIAVAIRSSRYTKKELLFSSFEDPEAINENLILKIEEELRKEFSENARNDERQKAEQKMKTEKHERIKNADQQARLIALKEKEKQLKREKILAIILGVIFTLAAIVGMVYTLIGLQRTNICLLLCLSVFVIFSLISIVDVVAGKEKRIEKWLVRRANRKFDKVYQKNKNEYIAIAEGKELDT